MTAAAPFAFVFETPSEVSAGKAGGHPAVVELVVLSSVRARFNGRSVSVSSDAPRRADLLSPLHSRADKSGEGPLPFVARVDLRCATALDCRRPYDRELPRFSSSNGSSS